MKKLIFGTALLAACLLAFSPTAEPDKERGGGDSNRIGKVIAGRSQGEPRVFALSKFAQGDRSHRQASSSANECIPWGYFLVESNGKFASIADLGNGAWRLTDENGKTADAKFVSDHFESPWGQHPKFNKDSSVLQWAGNRWIRVPDLAGPWRVASNGRVARITDLGGGTLRLTDENGKTVEAKLLSGRLDSPWGQKPTFSDDGNVLKWAGNEWLKVAPGGCLLIPDLFRFPLGPRLGPININPTDTVVFRTNNDPGCEVPHGVRVHEQISAWEQVVNHLAAYKDGSIGTIGFFGHGNDGGVSTRDPSMPLTVEKMTERQAEAIRRKLMPGARVLLRGCHCACSEKVCDLAKKFQRAVIASNGTVYTDNTTKAGSNWYVFSP